MLFRRLANLCLWRNRCCLRECSFNWRYYSSFVTFFIDWSHSLSSHTITHHFILLLMCASSSSFKHIFLLRQSFKSCVFVFVARVMPWPSTDSLDCTGAPVSTYNFHTKIHFAFCPLDINYHSLCLLHGPELFHRLLLLMLRSFIVPMKRTKRWQWLKLQKQ